MKEFTCTIKDPNGIHARPAGLLVREAKKFSSSLTVCCGSQTADLKRLFAVLGANIKQGDTISVFAKGEDEKEAATALEAFINEHF